MTFAAVSCLLMLVAETFVIGRDGVIRKKEIGAANWNSASRRAVVQSLLAEPAP